MTEGEEKKRKCRTVDGKEICEDEIETPSYPIIPSGNQNSLGELRNLQCRADPKTKKWICRAESENDKPPKI